MSYINPRIPIIENPTGLLAAIQRIQVALGDNLPWLERSFGRAYLMAEKKGNNQSITVPKVYQNKGEYYTVLPNDHLKAYSFFQVLGPEQAADYNVAETQNQFETKVAIVFYGNLKKTDPGTDHIHTDRVKNQILKVLKVYGPDFQLDEIKDENIRDIFVGYRTSYRFTDIDSKLLMYPNFALKFTGTLHYKESC